MSMCQQSVFQIFISKKSQEMWCDQHMESPWRWSHDLCLPGVRLSDTGSVRLTTDLWSMPDDLRKAARHRKSGTQEVVHKISLLSTFHKLVKMLGSVERNHSWGCMSFLVWESLWLVSRLTIRELCAQGPTCEKLCCSSWILGSRKQCESILGSHGTSLEKCSCFWALHWLDKKKDSALDIDW